MFYWDYAAIGQRFSSEQQIRRREHRAEKRARTAHAEDMQDMKFNTPGYWRHYGPHPWRTAAYATLGTALAGFVVGGAYYNYEEAQRFGANQPQAVEKVLASSQYLAKLGICASELTDEAAHSSAPETYRQAAQLAARAHIGCASLLGEVFVNVPVQGDEIAIFQRDVIPTVYRGSGLDG